MQEIVADTINDLEFLKLQLTTEIDGIKINIGDLRIYPKVQNYISLVKKRENLKQNNIYKDPLKAELKDKIDTLIDTYVEVKQYIESIKALKDYEEDLTNLDNLISIDGVIYNKVKDDKIYYSAKEVLKHLMALKERAGLPLILTIEELNRYIDAVRKSLQDNTHYEDDKVIDEILSFKVYQNPKNYDIKNVRELPSIDLEYLYEIDNLTEREKLAVETLNVLEELGYSLEETGTYFYKDVIVKIIEQLQVSSSEESYQELITDLNNDFSQFYFDIARNGYDVGLKTFHGCINMSRETKNIQNTLLQERIGIEEANMNYKQEALLIANYITENQTRKEMPQIKQKAMNY